MDVELETVAVWGSELRGLHGRLRRYFGRSEARDRVIRYLQGLLSEVKRKNGWQLAEHAGEATPDGMQRLLCSAVWSAEAVRDELQQYIIETVAEADGVLVADETGFLKQGVHSAGVKRQYSGTAGRVENCQIGVFLAYASGQGHVLFDRELYLPKEWVEDRPRREEAKIPAEIEFATKPALVKKMIERAGAHPLPFKWVTGDSIYGGDRGLRLWLEAQGYWFVLGVSKAEPLWGGFKQQRADEWAATVPAQAW